MAASRTSRILSIACVARDAQDVLPDTLECVRALADELVVLDAGSRDGTASVAKRWADRVLTAPWTDDFSAARNALLAELSCDWVLWIDAGEKLNPEDAQGLRAFVENQANPDRVYLMYVQTAPQFASASVEQIGRLRLMPRREGLIYRGRIGESLAPAIAELGITVEELPWLFHRSAREHDRGVKLSRAERNMRMARRELTESGPQPRLLNIMGEAHLNMEQRDQARRAFQEALTLTSEGTLDRLEAYYGLLTAVAEGPSANNQRLELVLQALDDFPLDAQLLCALGSLLQGQDKLELAARAYRTAFDWGQIHPEAWHLADIAEVAAVCLSVCLSLLQRKDESSDVLRQTLAHLPRADRVRRRLIELCVNDAAMDEALSHAAKLNDPQVDTAALQTAIRGACYAVKENWISAQAYLQTAYTGGCRDGMCLKWYAAALMANGTPGLARPIIEEWRQREPHNEEISILAIKVEQSLAAGITRRDARSEILSAPLNEQPAERILRVDEPAAVAGHSPVRVRSPLRKPRSETTTVTESGS